MGNIEQPPVIGDSHTVPLRSFGVMGTGAVKRCGIISEPGAVSFGVMEADTIGDLETVPFWGVIVDPPCLGEVSTVP